MKIKIGNLLQVLRIPSRGIAHIFYASDLKELLEVSRKFTSFRIVGNGSNVVISDRGLKEPLVKLSGQFEKIKSEGNFLIAGAGAKLSQVLGFCMERGLCGLEELAGIPATIGGAVYKNAGAFGNEICSKIKWIKFLGGGKLKRISDRDISFSYRKGPLKNGQIIVEVCFYLKKGAPQNVKGRIKEIYKERKQKGFLEKNISGCVFKNPKGFSTGRVIEEVGLKGKKIRSARVSRKHANVFEFGKNFNTEDFFSLMLEVRKIVYEKKGILLEPLVEFWGDFL